MTSQTLAVFALVCVAAINAQLLSAPAEPPQPYAFEYRNVGEDGGVSSHRSQGDGAGRVTGSYSISDPDGRSRQVDYVADELGYRATVVSNEPGVESSAPADVNVQQVNSPAPAPVAVVQPVQPVRRVIVARPAPRPVYLRPAPQPIIIERPIAVAPTSGYRVISVPRASSGYRVLESGSPYEYIVRR